MKDELIQINGKSYKKCEVVMLPTKNRTSIFLDDNKLIYYPGKFNANIEFTDVIYQHLYILSSEEIKEGDWYMNNKVVFKADDKFNEGNNPNNSNPRVTDYNKKIIATTDSSLTIGKVNQRLDELSLGQFGHSTVKPLPRPSDDFIKAYVETQGKGFDKVLVEYEDKGEMVTDTGGRMLMGWYDGDNLPRKWESDFQIKIAKDNTITIKPVQEEKTSWTRSEVIELCKKAMINDEHYDGFRTYLFDKWLKENL